MAAMVKAEREQVIAAPGIRDMVAGAPWRHALFTTYALSLSYFESELLPPLIRGGCDDIWLIADAEGYRASLLERRSARVGHEYRLIPAALPHGVFHAKSIYLAGEIDDLLLIGSGNVTFGGHGKNLEVFEALRPETAADAFEEFALFLESIGSRPDIRLARSDWIDEFTTRARHAARRGGMQATGLRLLHSLEAPVAEQLPALLEPYGACAGVTVMSPYHDPNGAGVRQLLEAVGAPRADVAVTARNNNESAFPFADAAAWERPAVPVQQSVLEKRFVHAKWYEFAQEHSRVLLTGSINATRKALATTDNVELGVLRILDPDAGPLVWEPAPVPAFAAQAPLPAGLGSREVAYASLPSPSPADSLAS